MPVRNAKEMLESARRVGIASDAVLCGTGLQESDIRVPAARITYRAYLRMHRNLAAHPLPADFGFIRQPFSIASYGMLGYAMMSCATLRQVIQIALKYYRTAGPLLELSFEMDDQRLVIGVANVFSLDTAQLILATEQLFTAFPLLLDVLVGKPVAPQQVDFSYVTPPTAHLYAARFDCPVRFDAPDTRFVLGADALALPLAQADADSAVMFERSCRQLLQEIEARDSLTNTLRQLLLDSPGSLPDAAAAAKCLHLGERTLRRRLADEGTTFQSTLDEVRCHLATDYLVSTHLSTQEIAELLGFSEATNFRRAFLRWTRRSPTSFRRRR